MDDAAPAGPVDPMADAVRMHLHRGFGWGLYGTLTAIVFVVAILTTSRFLSAGELIFASLAGLGGLLVTGILGIVTYAVVWPEVTASARGVRWRMCWGRTIDAGWNEIAIDVDEQAERGTLRLDLGQESVSVNAQTWIGFNDFVLLLVTSTDAASRLTPAARREVLRRFGIPG